MASGEFGLEGLTKEGLVLLLAFGLGGSAEGEGLALDSHTGLEGCNVGLFIELHFLVKVDVVGGGQGGVAGLVELGHEVLLTGGKEDFLLGDFLLADVEGALVSGCTGLEGEGFGLLVEECGEHSREGGFEVLVLGVLDGPVQIGVLGALLLELLFGFEELRVESDHLL